MTRPLRTQFILADAGHARWVQRAEPAEDFVTVQELKAGAHAMAGPQGVVFEASSGQRFSVEERDEAVRAHQGRFAETVADAVNAAAARGEIERLVVVAPDRTLATIRRRLSQAAQAKLAGTLAKDLTKVPDHELKAWLRPLEMG